MNHLSRLAAASGAGLVLTLTASPAMAAPPTFPGNDNGAIVEQRELVFEDGTYEYHQVVRHHGGYYNTTNSRDQSTYDDGTTQSTSDWKAQYTELENVTKLNSQSTFTENGETCRTTSQVVYANGDLRRQGEQGKCTG